MADEPATPLDTPPPKIHVALARVLASIGAVDKGGWNENQKYRFRGIDQFQNALHPALAEHGVICLPQVIDRHVDVRDRAGGVTTHVWLRVRYLFVGPAGDTLEAIVDGEAADTYDKATNKALSAALKYAVLQTFMVPTEDQRDGDNDSPDMGATADLTDRIEAERAQAVADIGMKMRAEWYTLVAGLPEESKPVLRRWCEAHGIPLHPARQDDGQFTAFRGAVASLVQGNLTEAGGAHIPDEPEFDVDGPGADGPADTPAGKVLDLMGQLEASIERAVAHRAEAEAPGSSVDDAPHRRPTPAERAARRAEGTAR